MPSVARQVRAPSLLLSSLARYRVFAATNAVVDGWGY